MATLFVGPFHFQRTSAVRQLVRPDEVAHFITHRGANYWDIRTFAEKVAAWQATRLRQGETHYISDGPFDAWQSPLATLQRGGGDCEDHAILVLSMLAYDRAITAQFVAGTVWTGRAWSGHAWVEGQDENGGFLIEATSGHLFRGVLPRGYRRDQTVITSQGRVAT